MSIELERRIASLEQQVLILTQSLLNREPLKTTWVSVPEAAIALGISKATLLREIRRSRLNPRNSDLKCGVHYRHKGKPDAERPRWQINVAEFSRFLAIPLEKRKGGAP
ncbi:MAG: hypothetical protein NVS2B14_11410 [Chamaesiphon sp.]